MHNGFFRVAAAAPAVQPADIKANTDAVIASLLDISIKDADLIVFPEMSITGYTCGDLFHNSTLLDAVPDALQRLCHATSDQSSPLIIIGAPLKVNGTLYNCAVAIRGKILAVIPKTYIPNYNEFYEKRWWAPAPFNPSFLTIDGDEIPFATELMLQLNGVKIGAEICEDLWTTIPPSSRLALAGAQVIVNLSASDDLIGKYNYLRSLIAQQSARCLSAYIYASAGYGESSTDLVFDAKTIIAENGTILEANPRWQHSPQCVITDIDIMAIDRDRLHNGSFHDCASRNVSTIYPVISAGNRKPISKEPALIRHISPTPFIPAADGHLHQRCEEIINIQIAALCRRLEFTHCKNLVIGISGGLDSTLALLVATGAFDKLGLDRKGIHGITMPGFGTTDRTHDNAVALMKALGISTREISIIPAVNQHFKDIDHNPSVHDVTYENSQARQRTLLLMDIANQVGGMVLGTGDLSELALGWATYNGDHMSMYGINAGIPKTLVRHLTRYFADCVFKDNCRDTLLDIIDTPISPELIPADTDGNITQKTEDLVGPYELHDFFLYYTLRYGFTPKRIYLLATHAFEGTFDHATIRHWIKVFFRRFFAQQFKRSCLPDGPKVGSVCLSPRGDWRMPSDASAALWLAQCDQLY